MEYRDRDGYRRRVRIRRGVALLAMISLIAGCAESAEPRSESRPFRRRPEMGTLHGDEERRPGHHARRHHPARRRLPPSQSPAPVILAYPVAPSRGRRPNRSRYESPDWFASHCYLVVIQDVRGTGSSSGTFDEYTP